MKKNSPMLNNELETFRAKVKALIIQLYRTNVRDHKGDVMPEINMAEEWEYEGQVFNALTERGLAYLVDNELVELFIWDDLDIESLVEVVKILENQEFD